MYVENKWFLETRIMQYPAMKIAVLQVLGACLELFLKQQMFTNILNATFIALLSNYSFLPDCVLLRHKVLLTDYVQVHFPAP